MRGIIPGRAVKSFAKAVHCLSKIGEELYLEALPDGIAIRTVNQSRSAYACFMFHSCFFLSYDDGRDELPDSSQVDDMVKCKIAMKSCLSAFKSVNTLEKSVDKCQIDLSIKEARLVFLFYCKHGITKTYNLTFQECESLQAVFTKDLCPNFISAQARLLNETVYNFPNNLDELTLSVNPELLKATNYAEDEPDLNKVIRTEMTLVRDEFDNYQIGVDTDVTFCLKELRAILSFAEFAGYPVNIHFETAGKPIVFSLDAEPSYEADFVLATLVDQPVSTQSSQVSMAASNAKSVGNKGKGKKTERKETTSQNIPNGKPKPDEMLSSKQKVSNPPSKAPERQKSQTNHSQRSAARKNSSNGNGSAADEDRRDADCQIAEKEKQASGKKLNKSAADVVDFFSDPFPYQDKFSKKAKNLSVIPEQSQENCSFQGSAPSIRTPPSVATDASFLRHAEMPSIGEDSLNVESPSTDRSQVRKLSRESLDLELYDEDQDDVLPATPPSKKFKSMFFGAFSDVKSQPQPPGSVLAADTDDENSS